MMGDVNWAVDRAYKMQEVREEYNILLTYEDGVRSIEAMVDLLPLVWMSYTFNLQTGSSVMVLDSTKYRTSLWKNPRNIEIMVKGGFYAMYATHPCLEVVRKGKVDIMECEGYQYGAGMADLAQSAHFTSLSVGAFPSNVITKFYHTPVMANVFISMWKKLIPKDIASKIEVGCQYPGGRLDQFYMLPSPEAATKRVLKNFRKGLKVRMESEKLFSLDQSMGND
ncbi:expressed unknown protein [Seminavis robusta]|uniref:Uncharacterized protein n=1 Tax=Seminavis robusta TaxID=568900 RepID=A0A9N8ECM1_9STRA|nr:expressed unknown protein [Seminavis robusta]|eukprot:Sro978_g227180.1 n/a (224) ;mRNA; r:31759-32532